MPTYDVPMEFENEDKIIGGMFSFRQMAYMASAASIDIGIWFLPFLPVSVRVVMMVPFSVAALGFAFFEHPQHGWLDQFLLAYFRYMKRPQSFVQGGGKT